MANELQHSYNLNDVRVTERKTVFQGFFRLDQLRLQHRLFEGGWGNNLTREVFLRGHAVAAVMYDKDNDLIGLVEQFRVGAMVNNSGISPWLFEVVAGMREDGEDPESVIRRELQEEASMAPDQLIHICNYFSSPGGTDEYLSLFCALGDLTKISGIHGLSEEGEDIRVLVIPAKKVFVELYDGKFNNAATLICLQWLQLHRQSLIDGSYTPT